MKQTSLTVHRYDRNVNPAIGKLNVCLFCSEEFNHPNHIGYLPRQTAKQAAYLFFLRNAGFSYDPKTETKQAGHSRCARQLAKAERDARALGYYFEWVDDWTVGKHRDYYGEDSAYAENEPTTCESCICRDSSGECVASLSCIDDATQDYRRVIEAALASEALAV